MKELKMRYCLSYKDGKYKGKAKCNLQEAFEKMLLDNDGYIHVEVTENEYEAAQLIEQ